MGAFRNLKFLFSFAGMSKRPGFEWKKEILISSTTGLGKLPFNWSMSPGTLWDVASNAAVKWFGKDLAELPLVFSLPTNSAVCKWLESEPGCL